MPKPLPLRLRLLALYVGVALLARGVLLAVPIVDKDEASYLVGAWEWLRGGVPYVAFADHHPPLTWAYYALVERLLGLGMLGVRLVTTLLVVPATAYALSAFYEHDRRGRVAAFVYLVYGGAFLGHDVLAVNCEVLLLWPACLALWLLRDGDGSSRATTLFAAGALLAVAVLVKYQAALWLPAFGLVCVRARGARLLRLATLALGFVTPLLGTYACFWAWGAGDAFLYWNLTHNLGYAGNPLPAQEALARAAAAFVPFGLTTALLWLGAWRAWPNHADHARRLLGGVLVGSLLSALLGLRFYPHYLVLLYAPLALVAAPWLARVWSPPLSRAGRWALLVSALAFVSWSATNAWLYYGQRPVYTESWSGFSEVADWLQADRCEPDPALFVWGYAPQFYAESRFRLASRFVWIEASLAGYVPGNKAVESGEIDAQAAILPRHWDWLWQDLEHSRPAYVLDTSGMRQGRFQNFRLERFPRLAEWLARGYRLATVVDGVAIYRRRDCRPAT